MDTRVRFTSLLHRYRQNQLQPEEEQELMDLAATGDYDDILYNLIEETIQESTGNNFTATDKDAGVAMMLNSIRKRKKLQRSTVYRKWIAVTATLALCLTGAWYYFKETKVESPKLTAVNKQRPMAPGGNHAFLTLADGTVVTLDQKVNGPIIDRSAVTVVESDSGLLSYTASLARGHLQETGYHELHTPRGGQYQVILPDGTHVWLNSASSLRFPVRFMCNTRMVTLEGEGYFEVAKNASMPFIVNVHNMQVNVLGTHFDVMAYADEDAIRTTLLEGSVKVSGKASQALIKPGQQAVLRSSANEFTIEPADTSRAVAWTKGYFDFRSANIQTIMRQVSRWYNVEVVYPRDIPEVSLSGVMSRRDDASQLLEILQATRKVRFDTIGNKIIVMPYKQ
jgi:transmembrane sensor